MGIARIRAARRGACRGADGRWGGGGGQGRRRGLAVERTVAGCGRGPARARGPWHPRSRTATRHFICGRAGNGFARAGNGFARAPRPKGAGPARVHFARAAAHGGGPQLPAAGVRVPYDSSSRCASMNLLESIRHCRVLAFGDSVGNCLLHRLRGRELNRDQE